MSTTFYVFVVDEAGCDVMDSVTVSIDLGPEFVFDPVCAPDSSSYTLSGTVMTADAVIANDITFAVQPDGTFSIPDISSGISLMLTATDPSTQCVTDTIFDPASICCVPPIIPEPDLIANRQCIIRGDTTQLFVDGCVDCSYTWSDNSLSGASPIIMPNATTEYTVTITDAGGCRVLTRSIEILVTECGPDNIFLPNAFTPNDDGRNDVLTLQLINVSKVEVLIYSRWGEEIIKLRLGTAVRTTG